MEKNLPLELDREILIQLTPKQLVEIIVEQASATIKLNSRILELEQEIGKLKASRDVDSKTSSKPPSGDILKKSEKKPESSDGESQAPKRKPGGQPGIREKLVKGLVE
jgi:transposase